jgi:hypothetical protein
MERSLTNRSNSNIWYDFFNKSPKFDSLKPQQVRKKENIAAAIQPLNKPRVDNELMALLEDIYSEEQQQMHKLSSVEYMAITSELKQVFSQKLESTRECMAKLRMVMRSMESVNERLS